MIEINNLTAAPVDEKFFRKVAKGVLSSENEKDLELSIALIGKERMRKLNKRYLGKNRATDVLAFPGATDFLGKTGSIQKINILGEVVICLQEVEGNAERFDSSFKKELSRVLIHGILHLLGCDHEKLTRGKKEMEEKESYYLKKYFRP